MKIKWIKDGDVWNTWNSADERFWIWKKRVASGASDTRFMLKDRKSENPPQEFDFLYQAKKSASDRIELEK